MFGFDEKVVLRHMIDNKMQIFHIALVLCTTMCDILR